MKTLHLFCGMVALSCFVSPAFAVDEKQEPVKDAPIKAKETTKDTPQTRLDAATDAMMKGLEENHLKQFSSIEYSHGTIRAVEDVQQSIARAVTSCSKANPDIKDSLSSRFEEWKEALRPVMQKARNKLDKMILLQGFAQPSQVRAYLKKFDAAVIYRNQGIKAVPVTDKKDCQKLQDSMNKTQNDLINLLTESLELNTQLKIKE